MLLTSVSHFKAGWLFFSRTVSTSPTGGVFWGHVHIGFLHQGFTSWTQPALSQGLCPLKWRRTDLGGWVVHSQGCAHYPQYVTAVYDHVHFVPHTVKPQRRIFRRAYLPSVSYYLTMMSEAWGWHASSLSRSSFWGVDQHGLCQNRKRKHVWTTDGLFFDVNVSGYPGWETSLVCNYKSRKKVQKVLTGLFWWGVLTVSVRYLVFLAAGPDRCFHF